MPSEKGRTARNIFLVGTNGTGKSTFVKKYLLPANRRNLIIKPNRLDKAWDSVPELAVKWILDKRQRRIGCIIPELNTFTGNRSLCIDEDGIIFKYLTSEETGFVCGGVICDDFKGYIPSQGQLPGFIVKWFGDRRHMMIDIFLCCHHFAQINADFFNWGVEMIIFRTTRPIAGHLAEKIGNFEVLNQTAAKVNEQAKKNPHYCLPFKTEE